MNLLIFFSCGYSVGCNGVVKEYILFLWYLSKIPCIIFLYFVQGVLTSYNTLHIIMCHLLYYCLLNYLAIEICF